MKIAIFDIGQNLVVNKESFNDFTIGQVHKISLVLPQSIAEADFTKHIAGLKERLGDKDYVEEHLKKFKEGLTKDIFEFKALKNSTFVGQEKLFY